MSNVIARLRTLSKDMLIRRLLVFTVTFALSFSIYSITLLRETDVGDSAELALQSYQLGVAHPPGYPVFIFLGNIFCKLIPSPMVATNVLCAVSTSLAIAMMSLMILRLTNSLYPSFIAPLIFAFLPVIWDFAVVTEVYNVNILFLSVVFFLMMLWDEKRSANILITAAVVYGISFGTYLANALLLPAFIFLIYRKNEQRIPNLILFGTLTAVFSLAALTFAYFRSAQFPPMGSEYVPNSVDGVIKFFSGYQYKTMKLHKLAFYTERVPDHIFIFLKNTLFIGVPIAIAGLVALWRRNKSLAGFFLLIFAINMGYFTNYNVAAFYTMVTPSYFIFALLTGYGIWALSQKNHKLRPLLIVAPAMICAVNVAMQLSDRVARAGSMEVTTNAKSTLEKLPKDAVVICEWDSFTTLSYFQKVKGLRKDCTVIEFAQNKRRFYDTGPLESYTTYLTSDYSDRPVIIDNIVKDNLDSDVRSHVAVTPAGKNWFYVKPL